MVSSCLFNILWYVLNEWAYSVLFSFEHRLKNLATSLNENTSRQRAGNKYPIVTLVPWSACLSVQTFFYLQNMNIFFVKFYCCNTWCSDIINACVFQTLLYTHIRLACLFSKYEARLQCVQARLQALAILGMYITFHSLL